jgi:transcriptional regulator with XRE-family HTH domain
VVGQNAVPNFEPDRLRALRRAANLTQEQLDERAGLPPRTTVQYENGHRAPYATRLAALADALGVTPVDLTTGDRAATLAQLRVNAGLTQQAAADRAQLVRTRYSAIERGEIATVDDSVIASIAAALGVTARQARNAQTSARAQHLHDGKTP